MGDIIDILDLFDHHHLDDNDLLDRLKPALREEFKKAQFGEAVMQLKNNSVVINDIVTMFDGLRFNVIESAGDRFSVLLEFISDSDHITSSSNNAVVTYIEGDQDVWVDQYVINGIDDERDLPISLGISHTRSFVQSSGESFIIRAGLNAYRVRGITSPAIFHRLSAGDTSHFNHYFDYPSLTYRHTVFSNQNRTRDYFFYSTIGSIVNSLFEDEGDDNFSDEFVDCLTRSLNGAVRSEHLDAISRWKAVQILGLVSREEATNALNDLSRSPLRRLGAKAAETLKTLS